MITGYVVRWCDESGEAPGRTSEVSLKDAVDLWAEQFAAEPASEPTIHAIVEGGGEFALPGYASAIAIVLAAMRWEAADKPFRSLPPHAFEKVEEQAHADYDAARFSLLDAVKTAFPRHGAPVDCVREDCLHEPADSACVPAVVEAV